MTHDRHDDAPDAHEHGHGHGHLHEDAHEQVAAERRLSPSRQGTVVLDIGDGIGALVVRTTSALAGAEIEIARAGEHTQFVHTEVRERVLPAGSVYAGVFPDVPEGDYTLLAIAGHGHHDVKIRSGRVTEIDLSRQPSAAVSRVGRNDSSNDPVAAPAKSR